MGSLRVRIKLSGPEVHIYLSLMVLLYFSVSWLSFIESSFCLEHAVITVLGRWTSLWIVAPIGPCIADGAAEVSSGSIVQQLSARRLQNILATASTQM